jgi:hypothetical protein
MTPYPGMKNTIAKGLNGVHPAVEKPSRKTQTGNDP